jgi:hypothetical protein
MNPYIIWLWGTNTNILVNSSTSELTIENNTQNVPELTDKDWLPVKVWTMHPDRPNAGSSQDRNGVSVESIIPIETFELTIDGFRFPDELDDYFELLDLLNMRCVLMARDGNYSEGNPYPDDVKYPYEFVTEGNAVRVSKLERSLEHKDENGVKLIKQKLKRYYPIG